MEPVIMDGKVCVCLLSLGSLPRAFPALFTPRLEPCCLSTRPAGIRPKVRELSWGSTAARSLPDSNNAMQGL